MMHSNHSGDCQANKDNTKITILISLNNNEECVRTPSRLQVHRVGTTCRPVYRQNFDSTLDGYCNQNRVGILLHAILTDLRRTMSWRRGAALAEGQGVDLLD
eukprot:2591896-Rhodomonas_salina.1